MPFLGYYPFHPWDRDPQYDRTPRRRLVDKDLQTLREESRVIVLFFVRVFTQ